MAFAPPRRDKEPVVTSQIARGVVSELLGGDFYEFMDGTIGNLLGISRGWFLISIFVGLLGVLWYQIPNLPLFAFAWGIGTMPIWLPVVAIAGGWKAWVWYVESNFLSNKKGVLLDVKMPRELVKSPRAMDQALSQLWLNEGVVTAYYRKWLGQVRPIFSLELASFGGEVHFYMWCWHTHRRLLESMIYAQYPEVEITEAEDYATKFEYDPKKYFAFCTDMRYEPQNDAYSIKTYVDFELDKDPKEEYRVDPLADVIEFMNNLKPTEQIWVQIVFQRLDDSRRKRGGRWFETEDRYVGLLKEEIDNIRRETVGDIEKERWRSWVRIQQFRQTEQIRSIDRNMGKHPFRVGVRSVYIVAAPDEPNSPTLVHTREIYHPFGNPKWGNQLRTTA